MGVYGFRSIFMKLPSDPIHRVRHFLSKSCSVSSPRNQGTGLRKLPTIPFSRSFPETPNAQSWIAFKVPTVRTFGAQAAPPFSLPRPRLA
jgi:hypothetical protein